MSLRDVRAALVGAALAAAVLLGLPAARTALSRTAAARAPSELPDPLGPTQAGAGGDDTPDPAMAAILWPAVRSLCAQGLHGSETLAEELGPEACRGLIEHLGHRGGGDLEEQVRVAAEIRAGVRPMPNDPASLGVYSQLLLAQIKESERVEQQLTKAIGPDDARAFLDGTIGCWERVTRSGGPRPK